MEVEVEAALQYLVSELRLLDEMRAEAEAEVPWSIVKAAEHKSAR